MVELGTVPVTDDLHRFVVGPFDAAAAEALTATPSASADATASSTASAGTGATCDPGETVDGSAPPSDAGRLRRLPPGASLAVESGRLGYRDANGTFVPIEDTPPAPAPVSTPACPTPSDPETDGNPSGPSDPPGTDADPVLAALAGRPGVVDVQPIGDGRYAVAATSDHALAGAGAAVTPDPQLVFTADPYEGYQWTLDNTGHNLDRTDGPPPQRADADIDGREAAASARGSGVVVAVVDSGADMDHPDLAAAQWTNADESCNNGTDDDRNGYVDDCRGWDFGYEDNQPYAAGNPDHATHVAGIIAAQPGNGIGIAGIAPAVKIMNLSVAGPGGMTVSGVARAVRYAVDNGADVVNLSLGTTPGTPAASVQPMFDAVAYAEAHGVLLVVAAGNSNADIGATAVYPASIPGSNMLVVGASGPDDTRASFSNYGSPVDIFAPGVMIASTLPNRTYGFMSGTSQASPTTAATAALVLGRNPNLSPAQVIAQLVGTADQIGPLSNWVTNGVRLNAARAIGMMADAGLVTDVSINGLSTASGHLDAQVSLDEGPGFDRPYRWEATLVALRATAGGTTAYGLVDLPVTVDGQAVSTDQRGAVVLSLGGSGMAAIGADLPAGTYGLVVEAVPTAEPSMRLGQAFAATFEVAPAGGAAPGETTTTAGAGTTATTAGPGGTTATTAPTATTSAPGSSATTRAAANPTTTTAPRATAGSTTTAPRATVASTTATTAAPATTARAAASTTTAAAPTPTTARAATTTTGAAGGGSGTTATTAVNGQWAVFTISPRSGPVSYGTVVSITGSFPDAAYVWFGNQQGQVMHQSSSWILVTTPPVATAGPVDVTLRTAAGTMLTLPAGFTFRDATTATGGAGGGGTGSTTATTAAPAPSPTTAAPGATSPTTARSTTTTAAGGGTSPTAGPSPTTPGTSPATTAPATTASPATTTPADPALSPRAVAVGAPVDLGGGLNGVAFSGWSTLGSVPACASDPCRTRSI